MGVKRTTESARRAKITGKGGSGGFAALPHAVLNSENWLKLSPHAIKLLLDLFVQYKGHNNGDLCATWSMMEPRGWKSKATLHKALRELEHYGMLVKSRQGGRKLPSLYGVTFREIDECGGKLDIRPCPPPGTWKMPVLEPVPSPIKCGGWAARKKFLPRTVGHLDTHGVALPTPGMLH